MIHWWRRRRQLRRDRRALLMLWACTTLGRATVVQLMQMTGLGSGTIYLMLAELVRTGMVSREWDHVEPIPRCYYATTEQGDQYVPKLAVNLSCAWAGQGNPAASHRASGREGE